MSILAEHRRSQPPATTLSIIQQNISPRRGPATVLYQSSPLCESSRSVRNVAKFSSPRERPIKPSKRTLFSATPLTKNPLHALCLLERSLFGVKPPGFLLHGLARPWFSALPRIWWSFEPLPFPLETGLDRQLEERNESWFMIWSYESSPRNSARPASVGLLQFAMPPCPPHVPLHSRAPPGQRLVMRPKSETFSLAGRALTLDGAFSRRQLVSRRLAVS